MAKDGRALLYVGMGRYREIDRHTAIMAVFDAEDCGCAPQAAEAALRQALLETLADTTTGL